MLVLNRSLQSHSTLRATSAANTYSHRNVRCSQVGKCSEVADGAGDAPADACAVQESAMAQHSQPHQQPSLVYVGTVHYSHVCQRIEVADGVRDAPADVCVVQDPTEPRQPPLLSFTKALCATHIPVSALRLPMVLGMLPLMPVLDKYLP